MRLAESLDLPPEIERAREAGELVIFAGAGVSMGKPARLPGFMDLARKIAKPSIGWTKADKNALDQYLGRAEREKNVDVQARARMLLKVERRHTPLHEHLLRVFGTPDHVCLITTNFDPYFGAARSEVFPAADVAEYVGPALPPGKGFRGIARLHGALNHKHHRLVLTAADFADAYMADGWASRFLVRVFEGRTVLFVGYSVTDPLIGYLLHAIPSTGRWYALWPKDEIRPDLDHLITPIPFDSSSDGDRYGDLNRGLKHWAWFVSAPASEHDRKLRDLISSGPPASPIEADYVRARLRKDAGRLLFWHTAKDEAWFQWVAGEGILDGFTNADSKDEQLVFWARWSLTNFSTGERPPLLRFLRGRPLTLQPLFVAEIVSHLWVTKDAIDASALRQLVALIVSQPDAAKLDRDTWEWLIERFVREARYDEALALLRAATTLRLQPVDKLFMAYEESDGASTELPTLASQVETVVGSRDLAQAVEKWGGTLAAADVDRLLALGEQRMHEAYELIDLGRAAGSTFDPLSAGRTSIASSGQDLALHGEDVIVSIMRTSLDHLATVNPTRLEVAASGYTSSRRRLIRRIGLYAFSQCSELPSDRVLDRAILEGWARDVALRPELYRVLGTHYGRASEETRERFVAAITDDAWWGGDLNKYTERARFNLSQKMLREAPESAATQKFAQAQARKHRRWGEDDPEGLLGRMEVGWGGKQPSPIDAPAMAELSAHDAFERLHSAFKELTGRGDGYNLLGAVQEAARKEPLWAIELFELVAVLTEQVSVRIAEAVLWGLREADADLETKLRLLAVVARNDWAQGVIGALAFVIKGWSDKLEKNADLRFLDALDTAADRLFERSQGEAPGIADRGWTERAINHPAGHAAEVWWRVANARDWVGEQFALSIDDNERDRWRRVLVDETAAGSFARPLLGMATGRLSAGDLAWANEVIFPAFDTIRNAQVAAQLWDGFLMSSRWNWTTIKAVRPYLIGLYEVSAILIPDRSRQLGHLTTLLVADVAQPRLTIDELRAFVVGATEEARVAFADALPRQLDSLSPEGRAALWEDLLRPYWRDRRTNVPLPLSAQELAEMVYWVAALPEVADEVIAELRLSPGEGLKQADRMLYEWKQDEAWVKEHSTLAVKLILFLAQRQSISSWHSEDAVHAITVAAEAGAEQAHALAAAEQMVELGSQTAAALAARLRA